MPVSVTANAADSPSRRTSRTIVPPSVNFDALLRRFKRLCRSFCASAQSAPNPVSTFTWILLPFFSTSGFTVDTTSRTISETWTFSQWTTILPASTFSRSRMSLMRPSRCLPAETIF